MGCGNSIDRSTTASPTSPGGATASEKKRASVTAPQKAATGPTSTSAPNTDDLCTFAVLGPTAETNAATTKPPLPPSRDAADAVNAKAPPSPPPPAEVASHRSPLSVSQVGGGGGLPLFERLQSMVSFKSLMSVDSCGSSSTMRSSIRGGGGGYAARVKARTSETKDIGKPSTKTAEGIQLRRDSIHTSHLCHVVKETAASPQNFHPAAGRRCVSPSSRSPAQPVTTATTTFVKKVFFPAALRLPGDPLGQSLSQPSNSAEAILAQVFLDTVEKNFRRLPTLGQKNTQEVHHVEFNSNVMKNNGHQQQHHQQQTLLTFEGIQCMNTAQSSCDMIGSDDDIDSDHFLVGGISPTPSGASEHFHQRKLITVSAEYFEAGNAGAIIAARVADLPHPYAIVTEQHLRDFLRQVLVSLRYMHSHNIPHMFLTADKVFFRKGNTTGPLPAGELFSGDTVVVADYGIGYLHANRSAEELYQLLVDGNQRCDEALFPPEFIQGAPKLSNTLAADLWSVGMIACQLWFAGTPPFATKDHHHHLNTNKNASGAGGGSIHSSSWLVGPHESSADFFAKIRSLAFGGQTSNAKRNNNGGAPLAPSSFTDGTASTSRTSSSSSDSMFVSYSTLSRATVSEAMLNLLQDLTNPSPTARVAAIGGSLAALLKSPLFVVQGGPSKVPSFMSSSTASALAPPPSRRSLATSGRNNSGGGGGAPAGLDATAEFYIPQEQPGTPTAAAGQATLDGLLDSLVAFAVPLACSACGTRLIGIMYECQVCTRPSQPQGQPSPSSSMSISVSLHQTAMYRLCTRCYAQSDEIHPAGHTFVSSALIMRPSDEFTTARSGCSGPQPPPSTRATGAGGVGGLSFATTISSHTNSESVKHSSWGEESQLLEESTILAVPTSTLTPHEKNMLSTMGHLPSSLAVERRINNMMMSASVSMRKGGNRGASPSSRTTKKASSSMIEDATPSRQQQQLMSEAEALSVLDVDEILDDFLLTSHENSAIALTNLGLEQFPQRLVSLSGDTFVTVTVLDLANNNLETIPEDIEVLVNLRKLSLENNKLTTIPDSIGQLDDLQELDLNRNRLTSVPDSLLCCEELLIVMLDYNLLTEIPGFLFDHPSLREVFLAENPGIASWPPVEILSTMTRGLQLGLDNRPGLYPLTDEQADCLTLTCQVNVVWHKIYPDYIFPNMYLGSLRTAQDQRVYDAMNIRHVLTVGRGLAAVCPAGGTHKVIILDDIVGVNIMHTFGEAVAYLKNILDGGGGGGGACLVHCFAGLSRSATTVIAYLMLERKMRLDDAYLLVKKGRPAIFPNEGFFEQLIALDKSLFPRTEHRELELSKLQRK